mmetsp:Transcript_26128/g.39544  ORF Transcript_26128/g.39544 Transcript_26128/m.39544 type:complete len:207 (-) Transcript_26128:43-663(-)
MNRQPNNGLLEQFPSRQHRRDGSEKAIRFPSSVRNISNQIFRSCPSRIDVENQQEMIAVAATEEQQLRRAKSSIDPISIASIAGDSKEFRQLQEELRKSKMITGNGAQQVMKTYVEKQGRQIEERRNKVELLLRHKATRQLVKKSSKRNLMKKDGSLRNLMEKRDSLRNLMKNQDSLRNLMENATLMERNTSPRNTSPCNIPVKIS